MGPVSIIERFHCTMHVQIECGAHLLYLLPYMYIPGSGVDLDAVANACLLDASLNCHAFIKQQSICYTVVPTPAVRFEYNTLTLQESNTRGFKLHIELLPYVRYVSVFRNQPPVVWEYVCIYNTCTSRSKSLFA